MLCERFQIKALHLIYRMPLIYTLRSAAVLFHIYCRNTKSNRIMPARRIIRRRAKEAQHWSFRPAFGQTEPGPAVPEEEESGGNQNTNNNSSSPGAHAPTPGAPAPPPRAPAPRAPAPTPAPRAPVPAPRVPAPRAPVLPCSPAASSEQLRPVPTVSGAVACSSGREGIGSALVSELKMRIEQKIIEANQSYYY